IRDAEAMLETFQHLASTDSGLDASVLAAAQDFLGRRKEQLTAEGDSVGEQVHAVCALLTEALPRIPAWPLAGGGFSMIGSGLERVYRQGARSFHRAYETGAPADFHEWRKRVKDHWYHLRLLSDIWPGVMRGHRRSLRDLSELVGDHHNLAVLWELFAAAPELPPRLKTELDGCIHARMQALEKLAQRVGALVYAETPGALRRRLKRYWQSWRK
ncbi:MAG: CHAD domain-containing protein, partial [Candidatus Hydrogenedentes bacterium]|nr:CHAD domain-containing protein [Candidatus Hydrogenedentota bacterium]